MRVLFVAPYLPTPGSGGRTRLLNFMERLGRSHELAFVGFNAHDQSASDLTYPGAVVPPVPVRDRPGGARGALKFYRERLEAFPAFIAARTSPELSRALAETCATFRPDLVQIETTEMAQYLPAVPGGITKALDLQDVASRWFARVAHEGASRKGRALMMFELLKVRRYEVRHVRMADVVFVTSDIERAHLNGLTGVDAIEVPNGVDTTAYAPMPAVTEDTNSIVFVGPLNYDPNLVGLRWFMERVFPIVRAQMPAARVDFVGDPFGHTIDGVVAHGRVDDVRPFVARGAVSIVPILVGTGTRYKILEGLSMGRAMVSTTVGAEGLGVRSGEHLMLADEPEAFARAVIELLRDPAARARLGAAGRAHVVERFDWEPLIDRLEAAWARARSGSKGLGPRGGA